MYQNIVVLTGAGISAESGLNTFRSADGLWENHHVEDVATPEGYARNPKLVDDFYNARLEYIDENAIAPNAAHHALAKLEQSLKGKVLVVTQNVDDLHEKAATKNLLHMHGALRQGRCPHSEKTFSLLQPFSENYLCDCCEPRQRIRPNIVWFGEMPFYMAQIEQALEECDLFIAIGTSGTVYPAAGFVNLANMYGADTLNINLENPSAVNQFKVQLQGKASELVPNMVEHILAGKCIVGLV